MNKENVPATPTFTRKRAKSVSTPPTAKPIKSARGILKGNHNDGYDDVVDENNALKDEVYRLNGVLEESASMIASLGL